MDVTSLRQALQEAAAADDPVAPVDMRETHISLVALTRRHAFKVKKPVELGFLDYSTLEKRRFYCEHELILNRRLSSEVYLTVVALHRNDQRYTFDGPGKIVEYAVKMRRLSPHDALEARIQRADVPAALIPALARRLAEFHAAYPVPPSQPGYGTLSHVQEDWEENFAQTAEQVGRTLSAQRYELIRQAVSAFLNRHPDWFAQRVRDGRIRDCHGDLRAEHVYWEAGRLQVIDCIEFNQRFRFIDVASEVAFLTVDLERLGAAELAHAFVRAYVAQADDVSLYRLLDFYGCYRAYVRGKVTSMRLQAGTLPGLRLHLQRRAEGYFQVAERYAKRLTRPLLLLTTGLIASGKSTVAQGIAEALDLDLYSSDRVRKNRAGLAPETSQRAAFGEGLYTAEATQQTYDALADLTAHSLRQGSSVIVDASFAKRAARRRLLTLARDSGALCYVLECWAPEEILRTRLRARAQSPTPISDAREEILPEFRRHYEPVEADEGAWHVRLDTRQGVTACVQEVLAAIQEQKS